MLSCKLYHKTTWFETPATTKEKQLIQWLQIISQNYVVWNNNVCARAFIRWGCKLYHKTTWFETASQPHSQAQHRRVANYITKLRGLKHMRHRVSDSFIFRLQIISQNYVVWNFMQEALKGASKTGCKLYHKTTWFETECLN